LEGSFFSIGVDLVGGVLGAARPGVLHPQSVRTALVRSDWKKGRKEMDGQLLILLLGTIVGPYVIAVNGLMVMLVVVLSANSLQWPRPREDYLPKRGNRSMPVM
jgi:hypothetical protein